MSDPVLKLGTKSADVRRLQEQLAALGYLSATQVDGDFGPKTKFAVLAFQDDHGLGADGVVGTQTWEALRAAATPSIPNNVADPGDPEAVTYEDFELLMIDRREEHSPLVKRDKKMVPYEPAERAWSETTGITLHQTACDMGERIARYDTIGCHFVVLRSGRVLRMADCDRVVYHGNGWNARCVGIEVNGLYSGLEDDPDTAQDESLRTTWDDPSTPTREQPMQVTPAAMRSLRMLCRWICLDVQRRGGKISVLNAHRQSSMDRRNDPGSEIWHQAALSLHSELGLTDGGVGFTVGGMAIPESWDPRCKGIAY